MKRRLQRLQKLQGLREIARLQAMREAADALGELSRAQAVARRSGELGADTFAAQDSGDLQNALRFGAALVRLREDAAHGVTLAEEGAQTARTLLQLRTREHDVLRDKIDQAQRAAKRQRPGPSPALARSLNSAQAKPTAASRRERHAP